MLEIRNNYTAVPLYPTLENCRDGIMDAEEYRRRALYHFALARQMTNVAHRAAFLDLASIWMRLAQQAESNKRIVQQERELLLKQNAKP
jgi:hypothetical protein